MGYSFPGHTKPNRCGNKGKNGCGIQANPIVPLMVMGNLNLGLVPGNKSSP